MLYILVYTVRQFIGDVSIAAGCFTAGSASSTGCHARPQSQQPPSDTQAMDDALDEWKGMDWPEVICKQWNMMMERKDKGLMY